MTLATVPGRLVTWSPGRSLAEPRRAREHAQKAISGWGLDEYSDVIVLIVTELVTNAVRHGTGPVSTRISCDSLRRVRVEVHDDGPGRPQRRSPATDAESGRGLAVIDGLLALHDGSFGVTDDENGDGKTVHVLICLPAHGGETASRSGGETETAAG